LVHYAPNEVGDLQTADANYKGLSDFGKGLVKKMNAMGMVIDLAHASYQTTKDVASITTAPIILSHSMLEMEADRPIAKRAISKDHAKLVAGTGGIIGAWPSGFNRSFDEYIDNIKLLVDAVGVDHVGIGTDMDANFKPVLSKYSEFPKLHEALLSKGFSKSEAGKIMGENAKRVLSKVINK
jgi:membrane dipeptidase